MENSSSDTDVAITGTGFLVVKDPNTNGLFYTRDGHFTLDKDGNLISAQGDRVQGKAIDPTTGTPSGVDTDIVLSQNYSAPKASSKVDMVLNLNANAAVADHYDSSITVYDNQGNSHTLDMTYTKAAANDWGVTGTLDGTDITGNITDQGGGGPTDMTFNANGTMTGGGSYAVDLNGYNIGAVNLNLTGTAGGGAPQYAASSVTNYTSRTATVRAFSKASPSTTRALSPGTTATARSSRNTSSPWPVSTPPANSTGKAATCTPKPRIPGCPSPAIPAPTAWGPSPPTPWSSPTWT